MIKVFLINFITSYSINKNLPQLRKHKVEFFAKPFIVFFYEIRKKKSHMNIKINFVQRKRIV